MAVFSQSDRTLGIILALLIGIFCFFAAQVIASTENTTGLAIVLGLLVAVISFNWPEAGLYILIFSMLLGPEIIVGNLSGSATATRGVTLRADDFLLTIIAFSWFARGAVHKELGLFLSTPLNRPIGIFLLVAVVSTALGMLFDRVRPTIGFFYVLKFVEYVFVYFAATNFIRDKAQLRRLVIAMLITAILVALFAIAQIPAGGRVTAPFEGETGEPNTLGGYLIVMIALFGGLLVSSQSLRSGLRYALGIVVLGIPFLYTLSRASYLGMFVVAVGLVLFSRQKIIATFSVISLLLALLLLAPPSVVERISYTFGGQSAQTGQMRIGSVRLDTSTSARLASYGDILSDFPEHPILGYGVTGYGFIDGQYAKVLIEMGIVGLLVFLWLLHSLFRQGWDALNSARNQWERGLCIGFLSGLAGLCLHAVASNTFIIVRIMEPFWFMAGTMTILHLFNTTEPEPPEEPLPVSDGSVRSSTSRNTP